MKKLYTTALIIFLSFSFCKSQYVTIPDAAFVSWLQDNYPNCMNGSQLDTTCSAILAVTSIESPTNGGLITRYPYEIDVNSDITGLKYFKNLDSATIMATDTGFIGSYPANLKYLDVSNTQNLHHMASPLPTTLKTLLCHDNLMKAVPPLPEGLKYLDCSYNHYYLTGLPNLPSTLDTLNDWHNFAYTLPDLPASLKWLDIDWNYISVIPTLPDSLTFIDFGWQFGNLYSIPSMPPGLVYLNCSENYLDTLFPLPSSLLHLDCDGNYLTSLPDLPPVLNYFDASGNENLKCIPVLKQFSGDGSYSFPFNLQGTQVTCLPNAIQHTGYIASIDTMLICNPLDLQYCKANWNIKGTVFKDDNGNCIQDAGEENVTAMRLNLYQAGKLIEFRYFQGGNYSFSTGFLPYHVSIDTAGFPFTFSCPASGDTLVNVTAGDSLSYNVNFAVQCKPGFDVGVWDILSSRSWRQRFFPGDTMDMYISAGDVIRKYYSSTCGTDGISGKVKIVIGGPANYIAPVLPALTPVLSGDTLIYTVSDFSTVNPDFDFNFSIRAKTTATIGDQVCFTVIVSSVSGDNNLSNNVLSHCFDIQNSFDPNEKEVSPPGNLPYPYNDWLTYTIHFQNTGTGAAQNIQVLDTLDSNLDPETFQLISSSSPVSTQVSGRYVNFTFGNIYLPDSTDNKAGSMGYVEYRIKPNTNLPSGTSISNKAFIYFDFNPPVVTNSATNSVEVATGIKNEPHDLALNLYPNPAGEWLTVSSNQFAEGTIEITDLLGRLLVTQSAMGNQTILNVSNLMAGVYFITLRSVNGEAVKKFVKQ